MAPIPPPRASLHGKGRAVLRALGRVPSFSELSYTYPLKLISPTTHPNKAVAILYVLSYGGGLVSDDRIELVLDVGPQALLICLTQGSTKVYRVRGTNDRLRASNTQLSQSTPSRGATTQHLQATIATDGCLLLLPEPVTCFASASYHQTQTFHLESTQSSAVLLDWFTSGRKYRGEEWLFERYRSVNEIFVAKKRFMRDVMLLESEDHPVFPLASRPLKDRLAPYSCYATLFLLGPKTQPVITKLDTEFKSIRQFQSTAPPSFIWSFTTLEGQGAQGAVVRAAATEAETIKLWLKERLLPLCDVVGLQAYDKIFL